MGWRESYAKLVELFPQVDARLIKGAALEHGNDIGAAVEFIVSELIEPDPQPDTGRRGSKESPNGFGQRSSSPIPAIELSTDQVSERWTSDGFEKVGEVLGIAGDHGREETILGGTLTEGKNQNEHVVLPGSSVEAMLRSDADAGPDMLDRGQEQPQGVLGKDPEKSSGQEHRTQDSINCVEGQVVDTSDLHAEEDDLADASPREADERKIDIQSQHDKSEVPLVDFDSEDHGPTTSDSTVREEILPVEAGQADVTEVEELQEKFDVSPGICYSEVLDSGFEESLLEDSTGTSPVLGPQSRQGSERELDDPFLQVLLGKMTGAEVTTGDSGGLMLQRYSDDDEESVSSDMEVLTPEGGQPRRDFQLEDVVIDNPVFDSVDVPGSIHEDEAQELGGGLDSMLSVENSFTNVDGMDGVDWESVLSSSIDMSRVEALDDLVEEAKTEKEVLITSIEEIRSLRLKTDQAEYATRQSKDEAARGGVDVQARVNEMRQILSRAREANEVHAGEVYGEKAVLATEARELQSRLVQVKVEKGRALAALNEIKASLQARIESANREREAAELEKVTKEALAREALAKEEALVAKVAQESRDLDAEAEACTKLREFLIERGSIVDALQGEVAVLCEDAEALKKDLDLMSLSCSGGYVHMLSRAGSDVYSSSGSRSGKFNELYGLPSESVVQPEGGAISSGSNSGSFSQRRVSGIQKSVGDKKSWSSLPSLLRALSGSQDLSNSSHSGHSSMLAGNSTSSSINALIVNSGGVGVIDDLKYPSSPSSITSPGGAQAEQELYEAQMAIFPGEEKDVDFSGSHNLDIFRSEKNESRAGTDDEDWHLLDPVMSSKGSSASSSSSSAGK